MISPKWQINLEVAISYFEEHLEPANYYGAGSLFRGRWFGQGALKLGLDGTIDKLHFQRICQNLDPRTGQRLTARQRDDRRIFCDIVISPPKGFSVLALVGGDHRLVTLHRHASKVAALKLEKLAMCRTHTGGRTTDIDTANVIGAQFTDPTSRARDPHLHDHNLFFNAIFDSQSQSWKALQNSEMYRAQKYVEALYYHLLAQGLFQLGYQVESRPGRNDFEIIGLDPGIIQKFSKRHDEIQKSARKLESEKGGNVKDHAEALAHLLREPKQKDLTQADLRARWLGELTEAEKFQIQSLIAKTKDGSVRKLRKCSPSAAISWALSHVLERRAVVRDHEVLRHALDHARGADISVEDLEVAFAARRDVLRSGRSITTQEVLHIETKLLELAQERKGKYPPLIPKWSGPEDFGGEQAEALRGILNSVDEQIILQGGAGTGKSTLLRALCQTLAAQQKSVVVLAPQAQQVRGLAADGLPSPQTLASVLRAVRLPAGAVVIADEAGQIGSVSLLKLFRLCRSHGCRLVLSGDTRQHGPVERGDALRSLAKYAQVETISLHENRRQDPRRAGSPLEARQIALYRESVQAAARGDVAQSLHLLDQSGGLCKTPGNKLELMAEQVLHWSRKGDSILAISQIRLEVKLLNNAIRERLQSEGLIGKNEWETTALVARDYTEAEKQDVRAYTGQPVLILHSKLRNWKAGTILNVIQAQEEGVVVQTSHAKYLLSWSEASQWQVCDQQSLKLARGERLQLKRNQRSVKEKDTLVNGEIIVVDYLLKDGTIKLKDGRSLPPEYRTFQSGYATTSYGGQGKTVEHVLVSDSGVKAATHARQWYVDISRGRKSATIFTTDKSGLMQRICQHGQNPLALEVFPSLAPQMPRAGQRARLVLKELAARWVDRSRRFIRQCCHHMQVLRTIQFTKQQTLARGVTAIAPGRTR
jgi:conjugative relaxase-like TrwC/TraI family protein